MNLLPDCSRSSHVTHSGAAPTFALCWFCSKHHWMDLQPSAQFVHAWPSLYTPHTRTMILWVNQHVHTPSFDVVSLIICHVWLTVQWAGHLLHNACQCRMCPLFISRMGLKCIVGIWTIRPICSKHYWMDNWQVWLIRVGMCLLLKLCVCMCGSEGGGWGCNRLFTLKCPCLSTRLSIHFQIKGAWRRPISAGSVRSQHA